jgi:hypothetical protein
LAVGNLAVGNLAVGNLAVGNLAVGNLAVGNLAVGNCSIQATQVTVWKIMSPRQHSSVGLISCRVVLHHLPLLMRSYATHLAVESCLFC